ncbi:tautomerase family protein [Leifsonia shinshuensis]|uniref:Phenylpyruvate tautomerase PptA (4-oxalocrotonate tautomerase family) n=1 Tax=Leifsonia shinshuensis TaxID=150026 RepID=A0A853D4W4_9MICO|nr:tautomerase family protein [Leifsonia shinshuensis]NYJ25675.1 phenylpyruvate tautomerase PptA (4-oxalocrotonate tautomerase family) [Leifsonia shinshuensis]
MPLVRIELQEGRTPAAVRAIADAVHAAIVSEYRIPVRDRFQIIAERPAGSIIAEDAGLGFDRTDGVVVIQIFTQRGRAAEAKQALFAEIARQLAAVGVAGEDVFIGYVENGPEDWSFGFGRSQYLTGELAVPSASAA